MSRHADHIRLTVARDDTSAIVASWRRCLLNYKLDPDGGDAPYREDEALDASLVGNADLIAIARPCLDQLFALLANTDCAVLLADRAGLLIEIRTTRAMDAWGRSPKDWLGTCYLEEKLGTNGIGTCLAEERGVIIRGPEHFLARYTNRVNISSPLFGPEGELIGCLNVNQSTESHDARLDGFLSTSLSNFARRIETELFARAHPATRLVLASPHGARLDALLAVDSDNRVIGATRGARRLLDLGDRVIGRTWNMNEFFPVPADGDGLADVERRAIIRAMARCGGNHSAAAKAIGISRSTLYRKLKSYAGPVPTTSAGVKPRSSA